MRRLKVTCVFAIYIAVLLWAYATWISPFYSYNGYNLNWPGPARLAWILILALAPATFIPCRLSRPSVLVVWWLYATVYIGSILVPALSLTLTTAELLPLDVAILLCMAILAYATSVKLISLRRLRISAKYFWSVLFTVWGVTLVIICAQFRVSTLVSNIASLFMGGDEYGIRGYLMAQASQSGRLFAYELGQLGEAIDPFLIVYGLLYRRRKYLAVGIAGQLIIFAIAGGKSTLFSIVFPVIIFILMRRFPRNFGVGLGCLLIAVVLFSAGLDSLTKGISFSAMSTRRTLTDPGLLTGFYYEHYRQVSLAGLGYHFQHGGQAIRGPSYEIGLVYFKSADIDANANLWAQGFADFGVSGIFGFTALMMIILWLYDSIAVRHDADLAILLMAMQAFSYSNSAPMTVFISHGGLGTALLLWAVPRPEADEGKFEKVYT